MHEALSASNFPYHLDLMLNHVNLIETLRASGIPAYVFDSGGDTLHVAVNLLDDEVTQDLLQIASAEDHTLFVGLMGWRDGESWEADEWKAMSSPEEAAAHIRDFWSRRAELVERFHAGDL